jgi:cysteine desulfurase family protein (TIGR01976 family)
MSDVTVSFDAGDSAGSFDPIACRRQFPAMTRHVRGQPVAFFDGPAGSQVPQRVIDAIGDYLISTNANHGGVFATSVASDAVLHAAHEAVADFLGSDDPDCVAFGPNMTTLTLSLSRALARNWRPGDEVLVSRLDHDANVTPWVLAARDAGAVVKHIAIRPEDCTLDMDDFARQLSPRTRLVAVGAASNAVGTVNPVAEIVRAAHQVGAQVFVDAVHYAPHRAIDVGAWDCDYLACSAYKFFGPHVGILWGRRELLAELVPYKLRPAPDDLPGRWMTGTQCHEGIAGTMAAVDYLADLGRHASPIVAENRRQALVAAFATITDYENYLADQLLAGLAELGEIKVWGITDRSALAGRVPTFSFTHQRATPRQVAEQLAARGIFVWHGNFYALPLTEALGLEPDGLVRVGLLHYNTKEEIQRLLSALAVIA